MQNSLLPMQPLLPPLLEEATDRLLVVCDGEEEEGWRKPFATGPGVRGRLWELRCSSGQSNVRPRGTVLGPVTLLLPPVSIGEPQLGTAGQGTLCFPGQASETREEARRQPGRSGRAFPSVPAALRSLPIVPGLSALSCSVGPRGYGHGRRQRTPPSSGPAHPGLFWKAFSCQQHHQSHRCLEGQQKGSAEPRASAKQRGKRRGGVPPKGLTGGWESDGVRAGPRLRPAPAAAAGTAPGVFAAPETGKAQQETSPPPKVP